MREGINSPLSNKMKNNKLRLILGFLNSNFLILFITTIGVGIAWWGILPELNTFNARAKIDVKLHSATSTLIFGPSVSEPTNVALMAYNNGNYNPTQWRVSISFCKDIEVINASNLWKKSSEGSNQYVYESNRLLVSRSNLSFFTDSLDGIGDFKIVFPTGGMSRIVDGKIPIALVTSSGERTEPQFVLVSLVSVVSSDIFSFVYDEVIIDSLHKTSNLTDCFDINFK